MNSDKNEQTISIAWSITDQLETMNIPYKGKKGVVVADPEICPRGVLMTH